MAGFALSRLPVHSILDSMAAFGRKHPDTARRGLFHISAKKCECLQRVSSKNLYRRDRLWFNVLNN